MQRLFGSQQTTFDKGLLELGANYVVNREVIRSIQRYAEPPHEPAPIIPGLSEISCELIRQKSGIFLVSQWVEVFDETLSLFEQFDQGPMNEEDVRQIVDTQTNAIGALVMKLDRFSAQLTYE